jgi:hypothetical protein
MTARSNLNMGHSVSWSQYMGLFNHVIKENSGDVISMLDVLFGTGLDFKIFTGNDKFSNRGQLVNFRGMDSRPRRVSPEVF